MSFPHYFPEPPSNISPLSPPPPHSQTDVNGLTLTDEFSLSFHLHFHKLLKWLVALPPVLMTLALVLASAMRREEDGEGGFKPLPSYVYPHGA